MIFLRLLADYLLVYFITFTNFRESGVRYEGVYREKELQEATNTWPPEIIAFLGGFCI